MKKGKFLDLQIHRLIKIIETKNLDLKLYKQLNIFLVNIYPSKKTNVKIFLRYDGGLDTNAGFPISHKPYDNPISWQQTKF